MHSKGRTRICLVEDDPLLLEALKRTFLREMDFDVCGVLTSAEVALRTVEWSRVQVLIVDLELPGMNGADLVSRLSDGFPDLKILVLTSSGDRPTVLSLLRRGACGYLMKGRPAAEIVEGVRELMAGGAPLSPHIARMLVEEIQCKNRTTQDEPGSVRDDLTSREMEGLGWVALGHTRDIIGRTLGISSGTVHSHIKNLYGKLRVHNRTEAINRARDLRLI
jgi:two-component system NarL family response regulator